MSKRKIRKLLREAEYSLFLCAGLSLALGIALPQAVLTTQFVQLALSLLLFGAFMNVAEKFIY